MTVVMPAVSVIIPTHDRRRKLLRLLRTLDAQDVPPQSYEVVVIDDGSTDGTSDDVARFRPSYALFYQHQKGRGPAAARNAGIRLARGDLIVLLDDDMFVESDFIRQHLDTQARIPGAVILGQACLSRDLALTPFVRFRRRLDRTFVPVEGDDGIARVVGVASANLSVAKTLFASLGSYCEDFRFPAGDDFELMWRLERHGVPIFYNAAIHAYQDDSPVTLEAYCTKHERTGRAAAEVLTKRPDIARDLDRMRVLVRTNGPVRWREDSPGLVLRKIVKRLLSCRPALIVLKAVATNLERCLPVSALLAALFRLLIGLHIFRGFRAGLAEFRPGAVLVAHFQGERRR